MTSQRLLEGLLVVELGDGIAGSVAAATLASLGATVRKGVGPVRPHLAHEPRIGDASAITWTLDRGKQLLDLAAAHEEAGGADIVIVDAVEAATPAPTAATVVVAITPFGLTGPDAGRPGGELVAAAAGGLLGTVSSAEDGAPPVSPPGFVALRAVGAVAALAALHGLDEYRRTRRATVVDVSAQEAVAFTAALPECAHVLYDCPGRAGSGRYVAPSGAFPCRDGSVRIIAVEDHQWRGLAHALGDPPWTKGLDTRPARAERAEEITERVAAWSAGLAKADCAALLQSHGVPATPVNLPAEVAASPQLAHRGAIEAVWVDGRPGAVLGPPWRLTLGADRAGERRTGSLGELRVVELTHVLAGPIVGALLGGMGAAVVRLEERDRLDIYRRTGPFAGGTAGEERGAYFAVANHSKASVAAEAADAPRAVERLLAGADVLIENVGRSRLERLGVDPAELAAAGLLTVRVSGFGSDGPLAHYRAYANNVQSYGGLAWLTRDHCDEPAQFGSVLADPLSSVLAALVVAAWALGPCRERGGVVDLAMIEVVAGCVAEFVAAASVGDDVVPPTGNDLHPYAPHGTYAARDGAWVAAAVQDDREWRGLVGALGAPIEIDRPEWRDGGRRLADRRAVDAALAAVVRSHEGRALVDRLVRAGVRAALVASGADLVADAHLADRRFFPEVAHPGLGTARVVGLPWRFGGGGPIPLAGPPALGSTSIDEVFGGTR